MVRQARGGTTHFWVTKKGLRLCWSKVKQQRSKSLLLAWQEEERSPTLLDDGLITYLHGTTLRGSYSLDRLAAARHVQGPTTMRFITYYQGTALPSFCANAPTWGLQAQSRHFVHHQPLACLPNCLRLEWSRCFVLSYLVCFLFVMIQSCPPTGLLHVLLWPKMLIQ